MLKVLWFSNTPANSIGYFDKELKSTGGWMQSLDIVLQNSVDLHIAYYSAKKENFKYGNTTYHTIARAKHHLVDYFSNYKKRDKKYLSEYLEIIQLVNPDIIHIHGTESQFVSILPFIQKPIVISIQGIIEVYAHKYFSGIEQRFLKVSIRGNGKFLNRIFRNSFLSNYKWFINQKKVEVNHLYLAKYIIGRTFWDRRVSNILAPNSKYYHLDELLRDSFYEFHWMKKEFKPPFVLHTTNGNTFYKGFETICQCLHLLNEREIPCEWRIAGIQENDLIVRVVRKKLGRKFPQKGLVFLGRLNEKELLKSLLAADIYVMPSHIENSPNNLCEAMILGIPCISTFVGGTGTIIDNGNNGLLIQDGDPWVMAGSIIELIDNWDMALNIGNNARELSLIRHNKNIVRAEILNIYNSILLDEQVKK